MKVFYKMILLAYIPVVLFIFCWNIWRIPEIFLVVAGLVEIQLFCLAWKWGTMERERCEEREEWERKTSIGE